MNALSCLKFRMNLYVLSGLGTRKIGDVNCPFFGEHAVTAPIFRRLSITFRYNGTSVLDRRLCLGGVD